MKYVKPEIEVIEALSEEYCLGVTPSAGDDGFSSNQGFGVDDLDD